MPDHGLRRIGHARRDLELPAPLAVVDPLARQPHGHPLLDPDEAADHGDLALARGEPRDCVPVVRVAERDPLERPVEGDLCHW